MNLPYAPFLPSETSVFQFIGTLGEEEPSDRVILVSMELIHFDHATVPYFMTACNLHGFLSG